MDITALSLFGRARYRVLESLFALKKTEAIHLREVARRALLSPTATQYELRMLVQTGLVVQDVSSGRTLYRINPAHPIAKELRSIIAKTSASREEPLVQDDAQWARKRIAQRADYKSSALRQKSPFLADRGLASSFEVDRRREHEK
jgi:hypothetical protein